MRQKSPSPIDKHVGSRVRMRRLTLNMSQEKLGHSLGLTFQQVQKYEKGSNRIGASRLHQIANTLQVPVAFFFEGLSEQPMNAQDELPPAYINDFISTSEGLSLARSFMQIKDRKMRQSIVALVAEISDKAPASDTD